MNLEHIYQYGDEFLFAKPFHVNYMFMFTYELSGHRENLIIFKS
jgi:hypothetical protein